MQGIKRKDMATQLVAYPYCEIYGWDIEKVCKRYKWTELKRIYDRYIAKIKGYKPEQKLNDLDYEWFN